MPGLSLKRVRGSAYVRRDQAFAPPVPAPARALPPVAAFAPGAFPPAAATGLRAPARTAFSLRARRLRLRDAVFLWIVPLAATLSSRLTTFRSSCSALDMSPPARA